MGIWKVADFQFEFGTRETFEETKAKPSGLSGLLRDKKFKRSQWENIAQ